MASASGPPGSDGPYANPVDHRMDQGWKFIPPIQSSGHGKHVNTAETCWNWSQCLCQAYLTCTSQASHANRRSQDWICHGRGVLVAAFSEGLVSSVFVSSSQSGCCLSFRIFSSDMKHYLGSIWSTWSTLLPVPRSLANRKWRQNKPNQLSHSWALLRSMWNLKRFCVCVSCVSQNEPEHLVSH